MLENYIGERINISCTVQKHGSSKGSLNKTICLGNIEHEGVVIYDHMWLQSKKLLNAKLHNGQTIKLEVTIAKRKRPALSINDKATNEPTFREKTLKLILQ